MQRGRRGRKAKTEGVPRTAVRLRPNTVRALNILAALLDEYPGDIADEVMQIGVGYIYMRRRLNLADSMPDVPELWQELKGKTVDSLRGTEQPPMRV
jgi:hypothetical protein